MSSLSSQPAPVAKTPFLAAAALFLGVAALVFALAIKPLGAAELLGLLACAAAAAVFATIPFARASAAPAVSPVSPVAPVAPVAEAIDTEKLAARVADLVEARLAAVDQRRQDEIIRAALAARPAPAEPPAVSPAPNSDQISAPAASAKPRLGRGLASLIHNPAALARPDLVEQSKSAPGDENERAAA